MSHFTYVYDGWKLIDEPRHDEKEAESLLASGLRVLGIPIEEICLLKQNDSRKQALGSLIKNKSTVPDAWIQKHLAMGIVPISLGP